MDTIAIPVLNRPVDATVEIPVSKSITNRALLVAALAPSDSIFPDVRTIKGELQCQIFEKECPYLPVMKEIG